MLDRLASIIRQRIGDAPYTLRTVQPRDLLSPARMDVMAVYLYAKQRRLGDDSLWARHLYTAHMMAFNGGREPGSDKIGVDVFLSRFDALLDSIAADGYRDELGPVPVGRGNVMMDGAHRLAACLVYDVPVPALFCDVPTWAYTAEWLATNAHHGTTLPRHYLEAMVTEYVGLVPDVHVALTFPQARATISAGIYHKDVTLTETGARNLMAVTYPGVDWTAQKARLCFPLGGGQLRVDVLQGDSASMLTLKTDIRARSYAENHSIHISDTAEEALRLARALLNDNSIDWLNRGCFPWHRAGEGAVNEALCLDGSSILGAYGLRAPRDIDYLTWPEVDGSHNAETARYHAWTPAEIIYNPARHFWMGDTKAATPDVLRHMKEHRGEAKDVVDVELLGKRPDKVVLLNYVYEHLRQPFAEHRGNASVVWSAQPLEGADVYAYQDGHSYRGTTGAVDVLMMHEPHTVLPGQYAEDVYSRFDTVFTFVPSISDRGGKFKHLYLPAYGQPDATGAMRVVPEGYFGADMRDPGIVMIHGKKHSDQPGEQYTARREFAEWFAAHGKTPMDVYGRPGFPGLANYRGECANKHETLCRYTFALAMDNTYDPLWSAGYFTREILDCLYCGTIPIIKGCYDIEQYLPTDCYIDLRHVDGYAGLDAYLQALTDDDLEKYRAAMRRYLASDEVQRYHAHATYMRLFALAGAEPTGDWAPGLAEGRDKLKARRGGAHVWTWAQLAQAPVTAAQIATTPIAKRILRLHTVKQPGDALSVEFLRAFADEFGCNTFIETGTASGQTSAAAAGVFRSVYTVELSPEWYERAKTRLGSCINVDIRLGNSPEVLAGLRLADDAVPLVWLDAHWSGEGYARGAENCPLLAELAAIATWPRKPPVILMDDMRYCSPSDVPTFLRRPTDGFPGMAQIRAALTAIDPAYEFVLYGDIGLAYLPHDGFDVSKEVREYQAERLANGVTSILILNHNGGDGMRQCLESIRACTRVPYELIVIDNASTDTSLDYLRTQTDVRLIENATNLGCPGGRAQGLPLCTGAYVVMLDNDTIVTPGWLETFQRHSRHHPELGLLGPRSNWASGPQGMQGATYGSWPELQQVGERLLNDNAGRLTPAQRLVGFCMFLTRRCIDKVGNIDGSFGLFGFEDDDYTRRAILAGFGAAIAEDVYIHHSGGPQVKGDAEYNARLQEAQAKFIAKWSRPSAGVLVFSKDRAAQLDLCLSSLLGHCREDMPVTVLYLASDVQHAERYQMLAKHYQRVTFQAQGDFRTDVEAMLGRWDYVTFVVDDAIFTHDWSLAAAVAAIKRYQALGCSLRLGDNITHGGPPEAEPFALPRLERDDDMLRWRWDNVGEARGWGYPLEVSSSVYPTVTIRTLTQELAYTSPNELEVVLDHGKARYREAPMLALPHSVAFCAPWNKVQNGYGWASGITAEELATAFDAGKRLDWRAYAGWETRAYHATPPVHFVTGTGGHDAC